MKNLEKTIMEKVLSNKVRMRPRWYFILGSIFSFIGLVAFSLAAIYSINLIFFLTKQHGPMGQFRLQEILNNFPLWILITIAVSILAGILFLKRYDFSYKKNFAFIILGFIFSIILAAFLFNYLGLNNIFEKQGFMRGFYRQIQEQSPQFQNNGLRNGKGKFYKINN